MEPGSDTLTALGETAALTATALDADGRPIQGVTFMWMSSNDNIATVNPSGTLTAQANGTAMITATTDNNVSGTATILVNQAVQEVMITPAVDTIEVGISTLLAAVAEDARGNPVTGASFDWRSLDEGIAVVDGDGVVTGISPGDVTITASADGIVGAASVTVIPAPGLNCGGLVSGTISAPAEVDEIDFQAEAGDVIAITVVETTNWGGTGGANDARATLFSPTGSETTFLDSDGQTDVTLSDTGTFLIRVTANNLVATGSYDLGLECP